MRTLEQNKRIWKLVSNFAKATGFARGYAEERMRDICMDISGQRSSSRLTEDQAAAMIQRLEAIIRTAHPPLKGDKRGCVHDAEALATNAQLATLNQLFSDVGIDTDKRQVAFCRRVIKSYMPITREDVNKIHEALEAMYIRRFDAAAIDNMLAVARRFKERCTAWERGFIDDIYRQRAIKKFKKLSSMKIKKLEEIHNKLQD